MKVPSITSHVPQWRSPPETLAIRGDEIHVWRASLDRTPSEIRSFLHNLAADERARAERFYFERDRKHFIVARGMLRAILGHYVSLAPERLSFCYASHGKPALAGESDGDAIRFNLSHSHGVALYAVSRNREVGIDIEHIRSELAVLEVAERFFAQREVAMLRTLPPEVQRQAFFRCWTRKESYIKARGEGLSLPLDQFEFSSDSEGSQPILRIQRDPSEASRWSFQDLTPAADYAAALAVEGRGWQLICWQWPDPEQPSV